MLPAGPVCRRDWSLSSSARFSMEKIADQLSPCRPARRLTRLQSLSSEFSLFRALWYRSSIHMKSTRATRSMPGLNPG